METLSLTEKHRLPYTLLLDPQTQQAAAYNNTHKLITETASAELVQYALTHCAQEAPFRRELHDPASGRRPLPQWAADPAVQDRLKIIWIKRPDGDAPAAQWLAIPPR